MSKTIRTTDLRSHLDRYGPLAEVITVSADHRPHVVTSLVEIEGDHLTIVVGDRTAANLAERPDLCLTWAAPPTEEHILIVDGTAIDMSASSAAGDSAVGDSAAGDSAAGDSAAGDSAVVRVVVAPTSGIRHRRADAAGDGPSCVRLTDETD
ncbi:MAG: pyridoxamine 5'-phosphate oxidase family protein [Actinobacteria bacterium]|nr:pyridoxamine 5'-phosphate oxidase family protein [Actinomycetota bacterium]